MPQTHTITTYQLDELVPEAQAKAIERCRDINVDGSYDWWETTIETAADIADMLGIDTRIRRTRLANGRERLDPAIGFSGFWSQGDGAHFEGSYGYAADAIAKVKSELPETPEVHRIAERLDAIQHDNACSVAATVRHSGHYQHERCTSIEVYREDGETLSEGAEQEVIAALRDLMRWIYATLEAEHEYRVGDEAVRETLIANEVEFLQSGKPYTGPLD